MFCLWFADFCLGKLGDDDDGVVVVGGNDLIYMFQMRESTVQRGGCKLSATLPINHQSEFMMCHQIVYDRNE